MAETLAEILDTTDKHELVTSKKKKKKERNSWIEYKKITICYNLCVTQITTENKAPSYMTL